MGLFILIENVRMLFRPAVRRPAPALAQDQFQGLAGGR